MNTFFISYLTRHNCQVSCLKFLAHFFIINVSRPIALFKEKVKNSNT
jgi:hypothetical protein